MGFLNKAIMKEAVIKESDSVVWFFDFVGRDFYSVFLCSMTQNVQAFLTALCGLLILLCLVVSVIR